MFRESMISENEKEKLRNRINDLSMLEPLSVSALSKKMKISPLTLRKFMFNDRYIQWKAFTKILVWVITKEREVGITHKPK